MISGWGINDANYAVTVHKKLDGKYKMVWICPYYARWRGMLRRCYSTKRPKNHISYDNCTVCEDWRYFSNFKLWMEEQDWQGKHLDKDLLVRGNKVYSPETCCFIADKVNTFITGSTNPMRDLPEGVCRVTGSEKFMGQCKDGGKQSYLGVFDTPHQAHQAYLRFKHKLALEMAETLACPRQKEALSTRYLRNVE